MKVASVSELKNGLSGFLQMVRQGQSVLVTDHSKPVAVIEQVRDSEIPQDLAGLLMRGGLQIPKKKLDISAFLKRSKASCTDSLLGAVSEDRDAR